MHADNGFRNDGTTRHTIEGITKFLPQFNGEATFALVVKSVDAIDSAGLVISP
jgi:hypothetical protein